MRHRLEPFWYIIQHRAYPKHIGLNNCFWFAISTTNQSSFCLHPHPRPVACQCRPLTVIWCVGRFSPLVRVSCCWLITSPLKPMEFAIAVRGVLVRMLDGMGLHLVRTAEPWISNIWGGSISSRQWVYSQLLPVCVSIISSSHSHSTASSSSQLHSNYFYLLEVTVPFTFFLHINLISWSQQQKYYDGGHYQRCAIGPDY